MTYDIGDVALLRGAFTSRPLTTKELATFRAAGTLPDGIGVDPENVVCTVRAPDDETSEPTVSNPAPGVYTAEVALNQAKTWWYAFDGSGTYQASGEESLDIREQRVAR